MQYKVTDFCCSEHDRGIAWDDPQVAIIRPVVHQNAPLSESGRKLPRRAEQPDQIEYGA